MGGIAGGVIAAVLLLAIAVLAYRYRKNRRLIKVRSQWISRALL